MTEQIVGNYQIERKLGGGDVGQVFSGKHQLLTNGKVAVKILLPQLAEVSELAACFRKELSATRRLKNPAFIDALEDEQEHDGTTYVVFNYQDGDTLAVALRKQGGRLPITDAQNISLQLANALAAAHEAGLPHGDLHPNNIFLVPDPAAPGRKLVRIGDFGIAKVVAEYQRAGNPPLPRTSPAKDFLAPEQILYSSASRRKPDFGASRLRQERVACQLIKAKDKHAGLVRLCDWNEFPDKTPYIVMDHLDGELLADRLKARGLLPEPDALRLTQQIASAMTVAHAAGVVHRDLKPGNVMIIRDVEVVPSGERAAVFDFGIAKVPAGQQASPGQGLTRAGYQLGTPEYMPPEQVTDPDTVTDKADVYALGITLYQMLGGPLLVPLQWPLNNVGSPAVMLYLARMLARDPDFRPTMAEVARDITNLKPVKPPIDPDWKWRRRGALTLLACCVVGAAIVAEPAVFPVKWEVTSEPAGATVRDARNGHWLGQPFLPT